MEPQPQPKPTETKRRDLNALRPRFGDANKETEKKSKTTFPEPHPNAICGESKYGLWSGP